MDYKLAKQLKENGFPQDVDGIWVSESGYHGSGVDKNTKNVVRFPNLVELIKACGEDFGTLTLNHHPANISKNTRWLVCRNIIRSTVDGTYHPEKYNWYAESPEEAVSKLWLQLNKKDDK